MDNEIPSTSQKNTSTEVIVPNMGQLLHLAFLERKTENPKDFTLLNVAKNVGLSPGTLAMIFQEENTLSEEFVERLAIGLNFKNFEQLKEFVNAKAIENLKKNFIYYYDSAEFSLNDNWYYIAILDLTTCSNFQSNSNWIAESLGLSVAEIELALEKLKNAGLLIEENGTLRKFEKDVIIPTISSREKIRHYHKLMALKAIEIMENNINANDFSKRLIKGSTFAVNPDRLELAKDILNKALVDVINTVTEGNCTELYHLNLHLFPLLKDREVKHEEI